MKRLSLLWLAVVGLVACSSVGDVGHPYVRQLTWFSFLNGDDIRASCLAGAPDRYRLVYNARYTKQIRIFEVTGQDDGGAMVFERVFGPANIAEVIPGLEQKWDWHGATGATYLEPAAFEALKGDLRASGAYDPVPEGLWLHSDAFYWVSVACRNGAVGFNAWQFPSDRFDAVTFAKTLLDLKLVDQPVPPPVPLRYTPTEEQQFKPYFRLEVGENGLVGKAPVLGPPSDFWRDR